MPYQYTDTEQWLLNQDAAMFRNAIKKDLFLKLVTRVKEINAERAYDQDEGELLIFCWFLCGVMRDKDIHRLLSLGSEEPFDLLFDIYDPVFIAIHRFVRENDIAFVCRREHWDLLYKNKKNGLLARIAKDQTLISPVFVDFGPDGQMLLDAC